MSNLTSHYIGGSSSPNARATHSPPPQNSIQVYQSIETPVQGRTIVGEDQTANQQLADEQVSAFQATSSAVVTNGEQSRNIVDIASQETAEPSVVDYVGPPVDGLSVNWLDNNICTIIVGEGPNRDKLAVHEKLLLAKSPYFRRILKASGKSELGEIFLNDVDVRLFKLLVRWMYGTAFGRIFRYGLPDDDVTVHDYVGLYVLASQLEIPMAKNCIIDTIYNYYAEDVPELRCPSIADLRMVLDNLPENSPLERLLTAHILFTCFSGKRGLAPVPDDWVLLRDDGRIGHGLITMLTEWRWILGSNVPPMKIKDRHYFHESLTAPPVGSRNQIRVHIKTEPGTDEASTAALLRVDSLPAAQDQPAPVPPAATQDVSSSPAALLRERERAAKRAADQLPDDGGQASSPLRPAKRPANNTRVAATKRAAAQRSSGSGFQPARVEGSPEAPINL